MGKLKIERIPQGRGFSKWGIVRDEPYNPSLRGMYVFSPLRPEGSLVYLAGSDWDISYSAVFSSFRHAVEYRKQRLSL